jgi:hypothetical protein
MGAILAFWLGFTPGLAQEAAPKPGVASQPSIAAERARPIAAISFDSQASSSSNGQGGQAGQSVSDASKPQSQTPPEGQTPAEGQQPAPGTRQPQTNRIMDIIPNFRAVSTDEKLPPQTVKEKFIDTTKDSFDYSAVFIPLALAGYGMARNSTPEFGDGGPAFARYFWHAAVDQTSENYMVEFIVPSLTHEDTRYYTLGRGGFWKRAGYSLSRAVITRNDKGKDEFNISEVVGAGASSGISTLYYPSKERSLGSVGSEWGLNVAIDAASFVVKEFWPDVNHALFHKGQSKSSQ